MLASLVVDQRQIPPDKNIVPTGMAIAPTKNANALQEGHRQGSWAARPPPLSHAEIAAHHTSSADRRCDPQAAMPLSEVAALKQIQLRCPPPMA